MTTNGWTELNGTEQFVTERIYYMIESGEIPKGDIEELESSIRSMMYEYESANEEFEEDDPMCCEEGDYKKVRDYLLNNNRYS